MPRIEDDNQLNALSPSEAHRIPDMGQKNKKRSQILVALGAWALGIALAVWLLFMPKYPEENAISPSESASDIARETELAITVNPQSAQVTILGESGAESGDSRTLQPGRYVLRVSNPGFITLQETIQIDGSKSSESLEIALTPLNEGLVFRDPDRQGRNFHGPLMVVVPKVHFRMGYIKGGVGLRNADMHPSRGVRASSGYAISKSEITVAHFGQFVTDTNYPSETESLIIGGAEGCERSDQIGSRVDQLHWQNPGFEQQPSHPVTCVSWIDATEYAAWLSRRTGEKYRLPTEAEWEFAARAYSASKAAKQRYYFGRNSELLCQHGNVRGRDGLIGTRSLDALGCSDGFIFTSPANSFKSNAFGLFDVIGNVSEWVQDCYQPNYSDAPIDGSAFNKPDCQRRVFRGGSWSGGLPQHHELQLRHSLPPEKSLNRIGFRVVRELIVR